MHVVRFATSFVLMIASAAHAQMQLGDTKIEFATVDEGREVLTARDDFVERLSPFDRAARMKKEGEVSEADYLGFVGENVMEWEPEERALVETALAGVREKLSAYDLPFPARVLLIKTTGTEEGNAAYTRANAIVFPEEKLASEPEQLQRLLCHELFHVLSRADGELREKLYATIGFEKCAEVQLPPALAAKKITNPDAPRNDHAIRAKVKGEPRWVVPVLIATSPYSTERGGEFFNYLELKFLLLDDQKKLDPHNMELVDRRELGEFFKQVGKNTGYIIHPEEILADNFSLLVLPQGELPSPEIVERMKAVLKKASN
ncbi:eCIS core domain-containing protein [Aeoliella sp. SH292]|uniref:eCIS core domain-containing protein n=1 Tax=Aeoliella sp. SH292 TaxID=3454464 RepID=UPI003F9674FC